MKSVRIYDIVYMYKESDKFTKYNYIHHLKKEHLMFDYNYTHFFLAIAYHY